jgi:hypothetical protein
VAAEVRENLQQLLVQIGKNDQPNHGCRNETEKKILHGFPSHWPGFSTMRDSLTRAPLALGGRKYDMNRHKALPGEL